jgi:hypothetical protein
MVDGPTTKIQFAGYCRHIAGMLVIRLCDLFLKGENFWRDWCGFSTQSYCLHENGPELNVIHYVLRSGYFSVTFGLVNTRYQRVLDDFRSLN